MVLIEKHLKNGTNKNEELNSEFITTEKLKKKQTKLQ